MLVHLEYTKLRALGVALLLALAVAASPLRPARGGEMPNDFGGSATSKHGVGAHADPSSPAACRPQDQMWVVSTREVGCVESGKAPALAFAVRDRSGELVDVSPGTFLAATARGQTRFWIHGYGVTPEEAIDVGQVAYERFVSADEPPVRFVVWSWPSQREGRRFKDIRDKGRRTDVEAYCLGWLIHKMGPDADVSAIGYSYGTRVIAGGLHLVGDGELNGLRLRPRFVTSSARFARFDAVTQSPRSCRAVLLAAAMGDDWLVEGGFNDRALEQSGKVLSIYSTCDRVLKWYPAAARDHGSALGYRGLASLPPRDGGNGKFAELDVGYLIGSAHDLETYLGRLEITAAARETLAPEPVAATHR